MIIRAHRGGGGNSVSFDARSKMDLRGGGGERKAVFKQKKKNLLVFNSQFAIVRPFLFFPSREMEFFFVLVEK